MQTPANYPVNCTCLKVKKIESLFFFKNLLLLLLNMYVCTVMHTVTVMVPYCTVIYAYAWYMKLHMYIINVYKYYIIST